MREDVKQCVQMRTTFFDAYITVPPEVQGEVEQFIRAAEALGEACGSAEEFESRFVAEGLAEQFNALLPRCTPKAMPQTKEQKQQSRKMAIEMMGGGKQIAKDLAADAAGMAATRLESEMIAKNREQMIEAGVFDDYTRAKNYAEDARTIGKLFSGLFKKKK